MLLNHFNQAYVLKSKAQNKVKGAIKSGKIKKPPACSNCLIEGKRLEGHHPDYNNPLDVVFLCLKCHRQEHKRLRSLK